MKNLPNAGRIFFGVAIAVMGIQTIIDCEFPYMLIPPEPSGDRIFPWLRTFSERC